MSRERHLKTGLHVMGYLKLKHKLQSVFNPSYPNIDNWTDFHEGTLEPNHPMLQCLKTKRWIYACLTVTSLATNLLEDVGPGSLKEAVYHQDISIWCRDCCHEGWS